MTLIDWIALGVMLLGVILLIVEVYAPGFGLPGLAGLLFCAAGANFVRVGKPMRQVLKLAFVRRMNVRKVFSHITPPKWFLFWRSARD